MNIQLQTTTTNIVDCCYLFLRDSTLVRGCRFIGRLFPWVAPMVIHIPRVSPVAIHIEPCGFRSSKTNRKQQPRMWLNVVIYLFVIQPRFGVAGSLAVCSHGLHPWLFTFHGFHLWLFTLNPAGSIRLIKKIAKRLNVNSHLWNAWKCNAWFIIYDQKQPRMWLNYKCNTGFYLK